MPRASASARGFVALHPRGRGRPDLVAYHGVTVFGFRWRRWWAEVLAFSLLMLA